MEKANCPICMDAFDLGLISDGDSEPESNDLHKMSEGGAA